MKIKHKWFVVCTLILFLIIMCVNISFFLLTPYTAERKYSENSKQITTLCEYLNSEQFNAYAIIRIDIFDSIVKMNCAQKDDFNGRYINIEHIITDSNLIDCLKSLKKHGFTRIIKEYNYLYFQIKSSFNESTGLIYSPKDEPDLSEINAKKQILKRLKNDGWYYNKTIYD